MRHEAGEVALTLGADDHMIVIADEGEGVDLDDLASSLFDMIHRFCEAASDEAVDPLCWVHE